MLIVQLVHQIMCALKGLGGDVARRFLLCVQSVIMVVAVIVVDLEVEEVGFAKRMADKELSRQHISLAVLAGADGRGGEYGRRILCRQERQTLGHAVVHQLGLGVKACLLAVEVGSEDAVMGARVPLAVGQHGCFFHKRSAQFHVFGVLHAVAIVVGEGSAAQERVAHLFMVKVSLCRIASALFYQACLGVQGHVSARVIMVEHVVDHFLLAGKLALVVLIVFHALDVFCAQLRHLPFACLAVIDVDGHLRLVVAPHALGSGVYLQLRDGKVEQQVGRAVARVALLLVGNVRHFTFARDDAAAPHGHLFHLVGFVGLQLLVHRLRRLRAKTDGGRLVA